MIDRLLRQGFGLDDWGEAVRLVTAFNTTAAQVDAFVDAARSTPAD